jgi:hypothetical protein
MIPGAHYRAAGAELIDFAIVKVGDVEVGMLARVFDISQAGADTADDGVRQSGENGNQPRNAINL